MTPERAERDPAVRRVERNAWFLLGVLTVAMGLVSGSLISGLAVAAAGLLMLIGFRGLVATADLILGSHETRVSVPQMALIAGRYVLLGLGLYGMLRVPGVGPIPVALGLSIFVFAVVVEGLTHAVGGDRRDS